MNSAMVPPSSMDSITRRRAFAVLAHPTIGAAVRLSGSGRLCPYEILLMQALADDRSRREVAGRPDGVFSRQMETRFSVMLESGSARSCGSNL
jgi:hypothetical protein